MRNHQKDVRECEELFERLGITPFPHQRRAVRAILSGSHTVIVAPTGSGKTEAAVIPILQLMIKGKPNPTALLYITPLRALINDLTHRLKSVFEEYGFRVARKHGDVSIRERKERLRRVPHVLITTPESLEIDLDMSPRMRRNLANVSWVIIDELHEIASSKRGLQLAVLLERLRRIAGDFQIVFLSATVTNPVEAVKPFLGSSQREVKVISGGCKRYSIEVIKAASIKRALKEVVGGKRFKKAIVFVNSRRLAEKIHEYLGDCVPAAVHHSSIAGPAKEDVEKKLKHGDIRVVVATKTLELGVDIGRVDLVIHVGPPTTVMSLLQRAGRSGHSVGSVSSAVIITDNDLDYVLALAIKYLAESGILEEFPPMPCYLDVVAREAIGCALSREGVKVRDFIDMVSSISACRESKGEIEDVVRALASKGIIKIGDEGELSIGGYFYKLWSKDGAGGDIRRFFSLIPNSDDKFSVRCGDREIGSLDSAYVMKYVRPWDRIRIGGYVWDIINIDVARKVVNVRPSEGDGSIPTWRGSLLSFSNLITQTVFKCLTNCEACGTCDDSTFRELAEGVKQLGTFEDTLYFENYMDYTIIYGPFGHKFFELLGYVMAYVALSAGLGLISIRLSPIGLAVEGFRDLVKHLRRVSHTPDAIVEEAVKISPQYQLKLRELLPTFASVKDMLVRREAVKQVLWELSEGGKNTERIKKFIRGEMNVVKVKREGISKIALLILDSPPLRPWYGGSWHVIAEALKGMALTVDEISEITGLPPQYIERKLKVMRKFRGRLKTVSFYDTFDGRVKWALAEDLPNLAKGLFKDCFTVPNHGGTYLITLFSDRYDSGKPILVRLSDSNLSRLANDIETMEIYKIKVGKLYGGPHLTYYHIPRDLLPLIICNAVTYLEGVRGCE